MRHRTAADDGKGGLELGTSSVVSDDEANLELMLSGGAEDEARVFHGQAFLRGLAVLADSRKALAVGAPGAPGLRIFSPLPAAMRLRLAAMLL